jgi:hypothetical protein
MFRFVVALPSLLIQVTSLAPTPAQEAYPQSAPDSAARAAQEQQLFTSDRLDQMIAPIALYPDSLLSQVLMAATYPLEVVEAARFMQANTGLVGSNLEVALRDKDWDPSVKSLCGFPNVLQRMNDNLDWLRDLGDASLAQQNELMDAAQRMRARAVEAGNLKSTKEVVITERSDKIIEIAPATPDVIYVPTYNPTAVYGGWSFPWWWYPAFFLPPPPFVPFFTFGFGVPWGFGLWGTCDWGWGHSHVGIDVRAHNQFVQRTYVSPSRMIVTAPAARAPWQFDPVHRHKVNYRNAATAPRFRASIAPTSRIDPDVARGRVPAPRTTRPVPPTAPPVAASPSTPPSTSPSRPTPRAAPDSTKPAVHPKDRAAQRVFSGVRQPALDRAASQRGNGSRHAAATRPAPARPRTTPSTQKDKTR